MPRHDSAVVRLTGEHLKCSCGHQHEVVEYAPTYMTLVGIRLQCECPTHKVDNFKVTNR